MTKEKNIEDRIAEAACIAESISTISYCIGQTEANLEFDDYKCKVFRGIEELSKSLEDKLTAICFDIEKEMGASV